MNAHTPLDNIIDIVRRFLPTHIVGVNDKLEIEGYRKSLKKDRTTIWSTVSSLSTCVNEELAILLTTSCSTGSPKLVRLSHLNLLANTTSICQYLNIKSDDIGITCLPLYYSFGLSLLNTHLYQGASVIVTDESFLNPLFWKMIQNIMLLLFPGFHILSLY